MLDSAAGSNPVSRIVAPALTASLAFLFVAVTIRRLFPPYVPTVTHKLAFFTQHKDEFDTLFIGSSHFFYGVSPKVFDETLRQAGVPSHSFNAAVSAMGPPESIEWAFTLLAQKPRNLRRVFMEIFFLQPLPKFAEPTVRDIYWQDLGSLAFGFHQARFEWPWAHQLAIHDLETYPKFYAWNFSNLGRGLDWFGASPSLNPMIFGGGGDDFGPDHDGFLQVPLSIPPNQRAKYHEDLKKQADSLRNPQVSLRLYRFDRLRTALEAKGIALYLVAAPSLKLNVSTSPSDCPPGILFRYDDPAKFPNLFRDDRRFNPDHLNITGAREFTRALAEDYLRRLRQSH